MKSFKLNNEHYIPCPGLGTFTDNIDGVYATIKESLKLGYRHIDTAYRYNNEEEIGRAIQDAIKENLVKREDLYVVSKLGNNRHRKEEVMPSLKESLQKLQLDYLDLYLIHWPIPFKSGDEKDPVDENGVALFEDVTYLETWKAMEECVDKGLTRSIGLSNFNSEQMNDILEHCKVKPSVNQVELHPHLQQHKLVQFCKEKGIVVTAYSPFASPGRPWAPKGEVSLLDDPILKRIAEKKGKTTGQVVLRWIIQRGVVPIPKSSNKKRLQDNFNVFDFDLSEEDIKEISTLESGKRYCLPRDYHPGTYDWPKAPGYPFNIEF